FIVSSLLLGHNPCSHDPPVPPSALHLSSWATTLAALMLFIISLTTLQFDWDPFSLRQLFLIALSFAFAGGFVLEFTSRHEMRFVGRADAVSGNV
ncbi:hypothetical protein CRG98_017211, partial [Punica granatum]